MSVNKLGKKFYVFDYKYIANRAVTLFENFVIGQKLSEYHTGYRAYSRKVLETIPFDENSDNFIFNNEFLLQSHYFRFEIGEVSCPTKYFPEASSINFYRSLRYGLLCCLTPIKFRLNKLGILKLKIFEKKL